MGKVAEGKQQWPTEASISNATATGIFEMMLLQQRNHGYGRKWWRLVVFHQFICVIDVHIVGVSSVGPASTG